MLEIKFTIDATPELIGALRDIAGAIHSVPRTMPALQSAQSDCLADTCDAPVICDAAEKAPNFPSDATVEAERPETQENVEAPKKRKPRAKKAHAESNTPVAPAIGDNSSPAGEEVPERATQEETSDPETAPETEPAPVAEDPAPEIVTQEPVEETPATEPAPAEEAPADPAEDPLAGKGQTGEILAELTRKAIGDLDALGVDRGDANRRIRDYCARNEIKFPTFPALLQAVGYAEAIAICKGARE